MRGKVQGGIFGTLHVRITPAYAGKRSVVSMSDQSRRDHPRVCGEKQIVQLLIVLVQGSPPRMRGKDSPRDQPAPLAGITPAYAGKSDILHPAAHYGRQVVRGLCRRFKRA